MARAWGRILMDPTEQPQSSRRNSESLAKSELRQHCIPETLNKPQPKSSKPRMKARFGEKEPGSVLQYWRQTTTLEPPVDKVAESAERQN
jgi:hypothetical protein